jgi:hypothetical protein
VFAAHYKAACTAAAQNRMLKCEGQRTGSVLLLRATIVTLIKEQFLKKSKLFFTTKQTRRELLEEFRPWLSRIKTFKLCLPCMQRMPEHKLPCGHMLCEECYKELAYCSDADPHFHKIELCPLCARPCETGLRIKPVTAGFRVLSIDGGGIRAVIPIQFLRALEQAIGLEMPVQEHFDLSFGTSSGMC